MPDTPAANLTALGPERAARVLRAKAGELETAYLARHAPGDAPLVVDPADLLADVMALAADVALVAELLAAHLDGSLGNYVPQAGRE